MKNNPNKVFLYLGGEQILPRDVVTAARQSAVVEKVIQPETQDARDYSCEATGGILLAFDNGDLQLWPKPNEDLILIRRPTKTAET